MVRPGGAGRVVELFAGVGGFRLALEGDPSDPSAAGPWRTVWANQWEPSTKTQHAFECYVKHFGVDGAINEDINVVLDEIDRGEREPIPDHELLVGGFPCQDYSVAKTLGQAHGIEGKKGILWWAIYRILEDKRPPLVFLENVDRLLKSPANQRGRDFAIILACLSDLGYLVEWRVVNAADYGFPQRRRRVFIVARSSTDIRLESSQADGAIYDEGLLARALPVWPANDVAAPLTDDYIDLAGDLAEITQKFGVGSKVTRFANAGVMSRRRAWSRKVDPRFDDKTAALEDILLPDDEVPDGFFIPSTQVPEWAYLKGSKREKRTAANGHEYEYTEGAIPFPDARDEASRTILTGEGGTTPSRFKHVVQAGDGRLRRLTPIELERLNGFPDNWTNTGMSNGRRAFMMGNALVVGLVARVGRAIAQIGATQPNGLWRPEFP